MLRKVKGYYSILIGLSIIGLWIMLYITGNIPELETEPLRIYFHLAAEVLMGLLMILSGIALIIKKKWGKSLFLVANGLVIYSVINASGYYANKGEWSMVMMFGLICLLSTYFTINSLRIESLK